MGDRTMRDYVCEACGSQEFEWRDEEQYCIGCEKPAPLPAERRDAVNWFEIPVADLGRALRFYGKVLGGELTVQQGMGLEYAMLPVSGNGVGGALARGEGYVPGRGGTLVYLNADGSLDEILGRVEVSGGTVVLPKTPIPPWGFIARFLDSEGNLVGLHSR